MAKTDVINDDGKTPIHLATEKGHFDVVNLLIDAGASLDIQDNLGNTPLHIASAHGNVELVRLFIGNGASLHTEN